MRRPRQQPELALHRAPVCPAAGRRWPLVVGNEGDGDRTMSEDQLVGACENAAVDQAVDRDHDMAGHTCPWCGQSFTRRRAGRPQRFCLPQHRMAYYSAARRFVDQLIRGGRLPSAALHGSPATCTLLPGAILGSGASG